VVVLFATLIPYEIKRIAQSARHRGSLGHVVNSTGVSKENRDKTHQATATDDGDEGDWKERKSAADI